MASSERQEGILRPSVNGKTRILGVFGCPVEHSLSPAMHNAAIAASGINYLYIPFSVLPEDIGPAVRSVLSLGIVGVNLTIPHKESVRPFLDRIAPEAQAVGAVNTVHNDKGQLVGYNTDGEGFAGPLQALGYELAGRRAVVLGAGGAARSVVYRLAREGAAITLVNRTLERAERLADEMRSISTNGSGAEIDCLGFDDHAGLNERLAGAELLVNTTSVGMSPHDGDAPPIPLALLHPALFVYDLIYNPRETRLLAGAREAGCKTLNGEAMLVYQGAAAFRIWTGVQPDVHVMMDAVRRQLAGKPRP